ncbi:MAG: hypothetical protein IJW42_06205 [Alistipes sp.]|nr:hypothetical protein [Alistipes sp.]
MKKLFLFFALVGLARFAQAQQYPTEWVAYTHSGYIHDVQSDVNHERVPETKFLARLVDIARTNVAKQIQIVIKDNAKLSNLSINGQTVTKYVSSTQFYTHLDLSLVETKLHYDTYAQRGSAIAFINRTKARQYYANTMRALLDRVDHVRQTALNYISAGFKERAKAELQTFVPQFADKDTILFWLNVFEMPQQELLQLQGQINEAERVVKQMLVDLQYGLSIYLNCKSDLFGTDFYALQNELKGEVSSIGCNYVTDATADFSIVITANAREGSVMSVGSVNSYFAYVDATIRIVKGATGQVIYENEISKKGGHTRNYMEAARSAYRDIVPQIATIIKTNIKN